MMVPHAPIDRLRGQRVVVLGATGFLGKWVARALTLEGSEVIAVVRDAARAASAFARWEIRAEIHVADLLSPGVGRLVASLSPDVVVNLAGYGVDRAERDVTIAERTNVTLVRELAESLAATHSSGGARGARLVHVGSALEYGLERGTLDEEGPVAPHTDYGRTKLAATTHVREIARRTDAPFVVARVFTAYGAGEHASRLLPTLVRAARARSDVSLSSGLQRRDFAAADDVAQGLLRLASSPLPPGSVVNLATGCLTSVRDFATLAAGVLGIPAERLRFGSEPVRADEMAPAAVAVERLRSATEWLPSSDLASGIRRMVEAGERFEPAPRT